MFFFVEVLNSKAHSLILLEMFRSLEIVEQVLCAAATVVVIFVNVFVLGTHKVQREILAFLGLNVHVYVRHRRTPQVVDSIRA